VQSWLRAVATLFRTTGEGSYGLFRRGGTPLLAWMQQRDEREHGERQRIARSSATRPVDRA